MKTVLLSSYYLAPVEYYAALFHAGNALIEVNDSYRKQSYRNRCVINGANGPLSLSIPVEKPQKEANRMKDIRIADHGDWRHLHWNAIISAYNSTPFFQYFEEDLRPFYEKKFSFLHDFNEQLRQLICNFIGIETPVQYTTEFIRMSSAGDINRHESSRDDRDGTSNTVSNDTSNATSDDISDTTSDTVSNGTSNATSSSTVDLRETIDPKKPSLYEMPAYYQVFTEKREFTPNLSIIDLLFNLGNEARLYLIRNPHNTLGIR